MLENTRAWSFDVMLMFNITAELPVLKVSLPRYQHQFFLPIIKKTAFDTNEKAIKSQLEYSLVHSKV